METAGHVFCYFLSSSKGTSLTKMCHYSKPELQNVNKFLVKHKGQCQCSYIMIFYDIRLQWAVRVDRPQKRIPKAIK